MREFKINEYITLKLENRKTNIYIADQLFNQCKFLLLNLPLDELNTINEIKSIDDAAEILDHSMEVRRNFVPILPETEFWGHCSNIQAWVESEYDTNLLHKSIAFPLLKELVNRGDPIARRRFKEEIAKRFENGNSSTIIYLIEENYLNFLNKNELSGLFSSFNFKKITNHKIKVALPILQKLAETGDINAKRALKKEIGMRFTTGNQSVIKYLMEQNYLKYLRTEEFKAFVKELNNKQVKELDLSSLQLTRVPDWIFNLKSLERLNLSSNRIAKRNLMINNFKRDNKLK